MPSAKDYSETPLIKMLLIGESGTGKTGALVSLVKAGYKLRIIDLDAGLDYLFRAIKKECPDKLDNVQYMQFRDKRKLGSNTAGVVAAKAVPDAYTKAVSAMGKWEDDTNPAEWGSEYILVVDSLTFLSAAAYLWLETMNPTIKDPRQIYSAAQNAIEDVLALLTDPSFQTNLIVISHITWVERQDGTMKGYPSAVGKALSPKIPTYFNAIAMCDSSLKNGEVSRTIKTFPTAMIDSIKNPAGEDMAKALPISTGLADYFKTIKA